jgi:hypothetical protein
MIRQRNSRIRILLIAPYPVVPATTGGKIRIVELARHLSRQEFDVSVLAPYKPGQRQHHDPSYGFELREVRYPFLVPWLLLDRPFPYGYLITFHPGYAATVKKFLQEFDVFQFEHAFFADLVDQVPDGRPIIYDAHNVEYDYVRSECGQNAIRNLVGRRVFHVEAELTRRAWRVLVCSSLEEQRFAELYDVPRQRMVLAPNGIKRLLNEVCPDTAAELHRRFPSLRRFRRYAVYSGSDVKHNRQAVRLIVDRFAPQMRDECAFIIHGTVSKAFAHETASNVFVDSSFGGLELYAIPEVIGLNPITQGAGTNLKVIQYLAHGIPVVSTEFGLRGYDELKPYVTVSSVDGFVEGIRSKPVFDRALRPLLENYLWEKIAANLGATYLELLRRGSRSSC